MKTPLLLALLLTLQAARAEFRVWTGEDGATLRAEFQTRRMDEVQLKTEDGAIRRVAFSRLSAADREYVQLRQPPTLELSVDPNRNSVEQSVTRRGFEGGYEILDFEITLKRKSRESYSLPLTIELYVITENEINHDYVLTRRSTRSVVFTKTRNKHVFKPERITLPQTEARTNDELAYVGYVALVRDKAGAPLEVKSNKAAFAKNAAHLAPTREGAILNRETLKPKKPR